MAYTKDVKVTWDKNYFSGQTTSFLFDVDHHCLVEYDDMASEMRTTCVIRQNCLCVCCLIEIVGLFRARCFWPGEEYLWTVGRAIGCGLWSNPFTTGQKKLGMINKTYSVRSNFWIKNLISTQKGHPQSFTKLYSFLASACSTWGNFPSVDILWTEVMGIKSRLLLLEAIMTQNFHLQSKCTTFRDNSTHVTFVPKLSFLPP